MATFEFVRFSLAVPDKPAILLVALLALLVAYKALQIVGRVIPRKPPR